MSGAVAFEVPLAPVPADLPLQGILDFGTRDSREKRRKLSRDFWQRRAEAR